MPKQRSVKIDIPPCEGERYEVQVPDTLDLAERARLALNGLTGTLDEKCNYEVWHAQIFHARPPYMHHGDTGLPTNNPKYAESLPMMRIISGIDLNIDVEEKMMKMMISLIAEDGLYYAPASEDRPWHEGVGHKYEKIWNEDFANVYGNARLMLAMMAWYQRDQNAAWKTHIAKIAKGLAKIAIYKDDYAYYPDGKIGEAFSYPRSGWKDTTEPSTERWGAEGSTFMYHGGEIRALARWYAMTGDKEALELARKLTNFVLKPKFWGVKSEPRGIISREHAHFTGHFHGHLSVLRGLLEYAAVTNNAYLKEFVREGYEYARNFGIARIGLFNEGCAIADMVALAIRLSDAGLGDYWDDVDQYVRNGLVEFQLVRADLLEKVSATGPEHVVKPPQESDDRVVERSIGAFAGMGRPTVLPNTQSWLCCTPNCSQALYYAWESIVRCRDNVVQVNLLLDRAAPWLDIDSYLPYEGKVVIKNKIAKKIFVRIPRWVDKKAVQCKINGVEAHPLWLGNYLVFDQLGEKDVVTIEFPMVKETAKYTLSEGFRGLKETTTYTCYFKGNTLVDISPREDGPWYAIFQRAYYKKDKTPMKKVTRYVSPVIIEW